MRPEDDLEPDPVRHILDTLQSLAGQAPSPVIRVCLEEAWKDIAHLTGRTAA